MSNTIEIKQIALSGTKKGVISVAQVKEPYGTGSDDVVSIGIAIDGQNIEWKTHIPYGNINALIEALQEAKSKK